NKTHSLGDDPIKQEQSQKSPVDGWMQRSNTQGSILINLLLKQPLIPGSSLGLCHLLSSCSEAPTGTLFQLPGLGREAQNLALTGLNLVARNEGSCDRDPAEGGGRAFPLCQLPGAVHLLPLVQFFIGLHCQALQDLAATKRSGAPADSPTHPSCVSSGVEASPEDSLCNLEGFSVASLSVLQHLVCHSGAVICLLLSGAGADSAPREGDQSLVDGHGPGDVTSAPAGLAGDQGQHPLLKMLLQLLAFSSAATGHLKASVLSQCLKVLVKLAENASFDFLPRYNAAWGS
ncbi:ATR-interacting protein, partial [Eschrichtius robustus]|nr:ATR-interacting protein [Eschrichtius robustus]